MDYKTVIPSQCINGADLLVSVAAVNDLGTGDWAKTSAKLTFCSHFITCKNDIITTLLLITFCAIYSFSSSHFKNCYYHCYNITPLGTFTDYFMLYHLFDLYCNM